ALDEAVVTANAGREIEFGNAVSAADRLEVLKPPYAIVARQEAAPRARLASTGWRLADGGTNLVVTTAPHVQRTRHALTVDGIKIRGSSGPGARVDLEYDLSSAAFPGWEPKAVVLAAAETSGSTRPAG
ncbi:MAG TPA: hypothetical protein DCY13_13495, partial [Verrucomicrobiales bacterium]|nr:hypothetical protein [Verrucomicrobiales bacterium]